MFVSTMRKGFHMSFKSGLTISVQWGGGNYCQNYWSEKKDMQSKDAEIAIWQTDNDRWFRFYESQDTVLGWQNAEDVAKWIARAAAGDLSAFGSFEEV